MEGSLIRTSELHPPAEDELEVSVFGPGYGEAIALHVGGGMWVLVDSCIEPTTKLPASLHYLTHINVDVDTSVRLIVATHWHDDHIRGISTVLSECNSADLAISIALRNNEFLKLTALYRHQAMMRISGLDEFSRIFQILEARKPNRARFNPPRMAIANRLLLNEEVALPSGKFRATVTSLSPSDAALVQAQMAFAELLPEPGETKRRIPSPSPNHVSVALWIEVGELKLLLGADLENTSDPNTGWSVVLSTSTVANGNAQVFKVPHHGSKDAHSDEVWSELLIEEPFAVVTPYRRGRNFLPSQADVRRLTSLTPNGYLTAPSATRRKSWGNPVVRDMVKQATRAIETVHDKWGFVTLRRKISDPSAHWQVTLVGDAHHLSS